MVVERLGLLYDVSADEVGPIADLRLALLDLLQAGFGQLDGAQRATCQPVALFDRLELQDGVHEASLVDHSGEPESDLGEVVEHRHGKDRKSTRLNSSH